MFCKIHTTAISAYGSNQLLSLALGGGGGGGGGGEQALLCKRERECRTGSVQSCQLA